MCTTIMPVISISLSANSYSYDVNSNTKLCLYLNDSGISQFEIHLINYDSHTGAQSSYVFQNRDFETLCNCVEIAFNSTVGKIDKTNRMFVLWSAYQYEENKSKASEFRSDVSVRGEDGVLILSLPELGIWAWASEQLKFIMKESEKIESLSDKQFIKSMELITGYTMGFLVVNNGWNDIPSECDNCFINSLRRMTGEKAECKLHSNLHNFVSFFTNSLIISQFNFYWKKLCIFIKVEHHWGIDMYQDQCNQALNIHTNNIVVDFVKYQLNNRPMLKENEYMSYYFNILKLISYELE
jgi:hypothetical protein